MKNDIAVIRGHAVQGWWGPKEGPLAGRPSARVVWADTTRDHEKDAYSSRFIILSGLSWDITNLWHGHGVCSWGIDKEGEPSGTWVHAVEEIENIMAAKQWMRIEGYHLEMIPDGESRPPLICRQLFGRMAECEGEKGGPWTDAPETWKASEPTIRTNDA